MRVALLNIHGGKDGTGARRASLPAVATLLASVDPAFCLLQEVDRRLARSGFADQAARLARSMPGDSWQWAFYGRLDLGPIGGFGNALLSRGALGTVRRLPLPSPGGEPRCAIGALGDHGTLALWNTHLGLRDDWRAAQLSALAGAVNTDIAAGRSVLVGGDFNARIDAPEITNFLATTGLVPLSPDLPTFPASDPAHRIDFLFGTPDLSARASGVIAEPAATDHCLVWAELIRTVP